MRTRLAIPALLFILCCAVAVPTVRPVSAAPPNVTLDIPLDAARPAASLNTYLKTATTLEATLKKRLAFFATLLTKTVLPALDGTDLHLVVVDATDLKGTKL